MEEYTNISEALNTDPSLSLELWKSDSHYGIENARVAQINEPNPHEGKEAGDGDQRYILGPRMVRRGFQIFARDAREALNLLERKCGGENVENTAIEKNMNPDGVYVHGYELSRGGVDNWINAGFSISACQNDGAIATYLRLHEFAHPNIVLRKQLGDIAVSLKFYRENVVSADIPFHIRNGIAMQNLALKRIQGARIPDLSGYDLTKTIDEESMKDFTPAIENVKPFGFPVEIQNALLYSIISRQLFLKK
jgi:hypothetical protein